jgi:integrase
MRSRKRTSGTGSIRQRRPGVYSLIFDRGYDDTDRADPTKRKRRQQWVTFHGSEDEAHAELARLLRTVKGDEFVEPSKTTLLGYLRDWLADSVAPKNRPATYRAYTNVVENHIAKSPIALIPLQKLRARHLEHYLASVPGAASSVAIHHAVLRRALRKAVRQLRIAPPGPAVDLERQHVDESDATRTARVHCWTAAEARRVLEGAKLAGAQTSAFMHLALDSGARRAELAGLLWTDIDLEGATVTIDRQLDRAGVAPAFGKTKTKTLRDVALGAETIAALRVHRQAQAELKMRNRQHYEDFGLVFAKEDEDLQTPGAKLGQPIVTLAGKRFQKLIAQAGVKRIKFHGCRHTAATLQLLAGVPPVVVASQLGHSVEVLLKIYAHALPDAKRAAADAYAAWLHSR